MSPKKNLNIKKKELLLFTKVTTKHQIARFQPSRFNQGKTTYTLCIKKNIKIIGHLT